MPRPRASPGSISRARPASRRPCASSFPIPRTMVFQFTGREEPASPMYGARIRDNSPVTTPRSSGAMTTDGVISVLSCGRRVETLIATMVLIRTRRIPLTEIRMIGRFRSSKPISSMALSSMTAGTPRRFACGPTPAANITSSTGICRTPMPVIGSHVTARRVGVTSIRPRRH